MIQILVRTRCAKVPGSGLWSAPARRRFPFPANRSLSASSDHHQRESGVQPPHSRTTRRFILVALLLTCAAGKLSAADPIDAVLTGGIHPSAARLERDYYYSVSAFNTLLYLHVYNNKTAYFPTQRLDTLTWAIEGPAMGLKVTGLGTNAAGTWAYAAVEPAGPIENMVPGALNVSATDVNGVKKTVTLVVTLPVGGQPDCPGGKCGAAEGFRPAGLQPALITTAPPVPSTPVTPPVTKPNNTPEGPTLPVSCSLLGPGGSPPAEAAAGNRRSFKDGLVRSSGPKDRSSWPLDRSFSYTMGTVASKNGSVDLNVFLGRCEFGKSAGILNVKEQYPTNLLSTPACLAYWWPTNSDCELITNGYCIRQVKVPEGLADVSTNTAYRYYINIFPTNGVGSKSGGYYQTSGPPLLTITVENPDTTGNTTNKLKVHDGDGYVFNYEWKTNGWELSMGNGYCQEYKPITTSGSTRLIATEIRQNTNLVVACRTNKYETWSFGEKLSEQTVGDGAAALVNTLAYYTNGYGTGLLQQLTFARGHWEFHQYDTNRLLTNTCMAYLNEGPTTDGSLCRRFEYAYGTNAVLGAGDDGSILAAEPRRTIQYLLNKEIGRSYVVLLPGERRDIHCVSGGAAWNASDNLVTVTRYYTNGTNIGRIQSIERPDGTMQMLQYGFGTNAAGLSLRTNIVLGGAPNAGKTDITDGTRSVTVLGHVGQFFSRTNYDIASGLVLSSETVTNHDSFNRPRQVKYLDSTTEGMEHGCCGPISFTNREGTVTTYARDVLQRTASETTLGITRSNVLDAAGNLLQSLRVAGTTATLHTNAWDTAGRLQRSRDAAGYSVTNTEGVANNRLSRTNTYADGSTRIEEYYRDSSTYKITGTTVHPMRHTNYVEKVDGIWRECRQAFKLDSSGSNTADWTKTYLDLAGRSFLSIHSGLATNRSFYNVKGQLTNQVDADGISTFFIYNAEGELEYTVVDIDRSGSADFGGYDRVTRTVSTVVNNGSKDVIRTLSYVWATNNSVVSNLISVTERSVDGRLTWSTNFGVVSRSGLHLVGSGDRYQTNTAPDGSTVLSYSKDGQLKTVTRKDSAGTQLSQTTYTYDAHGRRATMTDARSGTTTYSYNDAGQVTSTTSPAPGTGQSAQTTTYSYDHAGRRTNTVHHDGGVVANQYHPTGELKKTSGARTYAVQYSYDPQGRKTTMTTWRDVSDTNTAALTTWKYNELGQMTNKIYADSVGPVYTYTRGGRLQTRKWARGSFTTNTYNNAGDLISTTYSDGTSNVTYNLDRQGRRTNIVDGAGTRYLAYGASGLLLMETNASGTLSGISTTYGYDSLLHRTNVSLLTNATFAFRQSYFFDTTSSRLTNVSDGTYNAGYSYLANSPLVSQITFRSNSTTRMTTTKSYDYLNRLLSISSVGSTGAPPVTADASSAVSYAYAYNDANQRIHRTDPDGSYWLYEYDDLGQLTSGKHYWPDNTPVAGQQYEYSYDDIGNRTSTKQGGDASGAGLRPASYAANALNQYTSRDVPGAADIMGIAHPNASVTNNGQLAYRKDEYFWSELSIHNTNSAMWTNVVTTAFLSGTNQTNTGNLFLPKTPESFGFDADGNQTNDGRFSYTWDAENRLIQTESLSSAPTASKRKVTWTFDGNGRRVRQITYDGSSGSYVASEDLKNCYDGWACLADLNGTNNATIRSYLWGLDLSGSQTGAGGVGGLLAMSSASSGTHFYAMDGNGNVSALVSATTGSKSATHEYDPYGQTLRASGIAATDNRYRFSTKKAHEATDSILYEYRHYRPQFGRWLSRDRVLEGGGANVYNFENNDLVNKLDVMGLFCADPCRDAKLNGDDRGDAGGVVCCCGIKYACSWKDDDVANPAARQIIRFCVESHENTHFDDVDCPLSLLVERPPPRDPGNRDADECSGYLAEARCLDDADTAQLCFGDPDCMAAIWLRINDVDDLVFRHCGPPPEP